MSNNSDVSQIAPRAYGNPEGCFLMIMFGAALIAAPFFLDDSLDWPWWVYAIAIFLGLLALKGANTRRRGIIVNPGMNQISYGGKSVRISDVESCSTTSETSNSQTTYYVRLTGPFGVWKIPAMDSDQAHAVEVFIDKVRYMM